MNREGQEERGEWTERGRRREVNEQRRYEKEIC